MKNLEIYKFLYIILNNEKKINLYEQSIENFWKEMTDDLIRKSFDGENLSKYIYKLLYEGLNFKLEHILKVKYIWEKYYNNKYIIKDIALESPTTGIFLLIIKEYLQWSGIIESDKNDPYYICVILKNDILNIDKILLSIIKFYNKINNI